MQFLRQPRASFRVIDFLKSSSSSWLFMIFIVFLLFDHPHGLFILPCVFIRHTLHFLILKIIIIDLVYVYCIVMFIYKTYF